MAGGIGLEALPAPAWLGDARLARCRRALRSKLARETWKYSPLEKVTQALLEAPRTEQRPFAEAPEQVRMRRFSALSAPPELKINLDRYPLAGIAAALTEDGWLAEVTETPHLPLRLATAPPGVAPPVLLRVASGCRVEIEEMNAARTSRAPAQAVSLAAQVVLLIVEQDAEVHWSRAGLAPSAAGWFLLTARLGDNAALTFNHQSLAAAFQRLDLCVALHGAGANFSSTGAAFAGAGAHLDLQYVMEHVGRHTVSRVQQHSLAAGKARCTFNGRIHIHPQASGTDADLSNRNLALSADAEINTKPELEIYNDDVRCAHGATVGRLDDDALFYLQSRGLPAAQAQRLLSIGFLRAGLSGPFAEQAADSFVQQLSVAAGGD